VKPAPFEYHAPDSVEAAVDVLAQFGDDAKVLAGGQSLVPMLALRLAVFDQLVDIGRIDALKGIERRNGDLWIGAATTQASVEASPDVASAVPLVTKATLLIGHFQIRNRGTFGGSIAHADPAAEYPAVALALDARMELESTGGRRTVAARDFFTGLWSTATEPDELLIGVSLPIWDGRCGFAVEEFARRHGDFAIAGAAIAVQLDTDDRITRCATGLIGLGSMPLRAERTESALVGRSVDEIDAREVGREAMSDLDAAPSDLHGSATFRMRVGAEMVARALTVAIDEARHG